MMHSYNNNFSNSFEIKGFNSQHFITFMYIGTVALSQIFFTNNLFLVFIYLNIFTVSSFIFLCFSNLITREALFKYFLYQSIAECLFLFAISILYFLNCSFEFYDIAGFFFLIEIFDSFNNFISYELIFVFLFFIFIFISLFIKLGLYPFHR